MWWCHVLYWEQSSKRTEKDDRNKYCIRISRLKIPEWRRVAITGLGGIPLCGGEGYILLDGGCRLVA